MKCYKPILIEPDKQKYPNGILVPCRKCLACQEERRKELAIRFIHETWKYKDRMNVMILLTYSDESYNQELKKDDLKLYLKRCREYIKYHYDGELPRYVASGEYGETGTKRAHYHIVMNIPKDYRIKDYLEKTWTEGFANIIELHGQQAEAIFYTTGYVAKKIGKKTEFDRTPEFHLMSRGNGKDWIIEHKEEIKERRHILFQGKKINLPIYYMNKLELTELEKWEIAQEAKKYNRGLHAEYVRKFGGRDYRLENGEIWNPRVEDNEIKKLQRIELEYTQKYNRKQRGKHAI